MSVAEYLTQQIEISGKPQKDIAADLGYEKPNIITMFKQGKTKIPLNKVAPLANSLGIEPLHFLRLAMLEYSPDTWEVFESLLGKQLLSAIPPPDAYISPTHDFDHGPETYRENTGVIQDPFSGDKYVDGVAIKIEKGVPLPESRGRKPHGTYADVMARMEVGDSFVAEGEKMATLQSTIRQAAKRANINITARREGEVGCKLRVWRIAGGELNT